MRLLDLFYWMLLGALVTQVWLHELQLKEHRRRIDLDQRQAEQEDIRLRRRTDDLMIRVLFLRDDYNRLHEPQ